MALTDEGDWILDPFVGVGSSAVAALMHGRRAIGAEIMPEYVALARERMTLAQEGRLRVPPMDRPVFNPDSPQASLPPKVVKLGAVGTLWETHE
ncbi:MAG: site-specific DNA-methyltransferase [Chloroflexi bacterium]|nr:site-specific DNA-methyltransferase [Chloroflexota bacterium]